MMYKVEFQIYSKTTVMFYTAFYGTLKEALELIQSYIYKETADFRIYELVDGSDSLLMMTETYRKD